MLDVDVTSIHFGAFKSLYQVPCDLGHFTVITGPNGAGKSNLVEGIHFLAEINEHGLEIAVSRAGGYENIAHRRARRAKRPVTVAVDVRLDASDIARISRSIRPFDESESDSDNRLRADSSVTYHHSFSLRTATQALTADFRVSDEVITLRTDQDQDILDLRRGSDSRLLVTAPRRRSPPWLAELIFPFREKSYVDLLSSRPQEKTSLISESFHFGNALGYVTRALAQSRVFQLSPQECRRSGVPTPNATLDRYGSNLPAAADYLRKRDSDAWERVQWAMKSIMPGLIDIDVTFTEDRRLTLQFRERRVGKAWTTGEVSDGTIQALALFVALYDERAPLLIIEEPENSIHPWILRQFLDLCRENEDKQIVLTTHSPVVLNDVPAESVRIMWRRNGRSQLARLVDLDPELVDAYMRGELTVFDAYDSGLISEGVPPGYSGDFDDDELEELDDEEVKGQEHL